MEVSVIVHSIKDTEKFRFCALTFYDSAVSQIGLDFYFRKKPLNNPTTLGP